MDGLVQGDQAADDSERDAEGSFRAGGHIILSRKAFMTAQDVSSWRLQDGQTKQAVPKKSKPDKVEP